MSARLQAPANVPETCPFETEWTPAVVVVQMGEGLDELAIKKKLLASQSCKCVNIQLEANNAEGSSEPTELKTSIQQARSELAPGAPLPPDINIQLLQLRWNKDREIGWQQEWARRQEARQDAATGFAVCTWTLSVLLCAFVSTTSVILYDL